jgi:hypothetical protein
MQVLNYQLYIMESIGYLLFFPNSILHSQVLAVGLWWHGHNQILCFSEDVRMFEEYKECCCMYIGSLCSDNGLGEKKMADIELWQIFVIKACETGASFSYKDHEKQK